VAWGQSRQYKFEQAAAITRKASALALAGGDEETARWAADKAREYLAIHRSREMGRRLQSGWKPPIDDVPGVGDTTRPEFSISYGQEQQKPADGSGPATPGDADLSKPEHSTGA
jgi:hypothetical protein